jgi:hypothetical protein
MMDPKKLTFSLLIMEISVAFFEYGGWTETSIFNRKRLATAVLIGSVQ